MYYLTNTPQHKRSQAQGEFFLCANDDAFDLYRAAGMEAAADVMRLNRVDWTAVHGFNPAQYVLGTQYPGTTFSGYMTFARRANVPQAKERSDAAYTPCYVRCPALLVQIFQKSMDGLLEHMLFS